MTKGIVFGTGRRMHEYMMRDAFADVEIVAFCDNDESKHGERINGVEIISPQRIQDYDYEKIIIASDLYYSEIREQLIKVYGINSNQISRVEVEVDKYQGEMSFWKAYYIQNGFDNSVYKNMMLSIMGEKDDSSFEGKVVADFGCGPQGTLVWTDEPKTKIGIDVLATKYFEEFPSELTTHDMIYVQSSENVIPISTNYVDYLITINSLDHVYNLDLIAKELKRILKPNGVLLAGFNLNEPETECEPQKLTIEKLKKELLNEFKIQRIMLNIKGQGSFVVDDLNEAETIVSNNEGVLYIKAQIDK